MPVMLKVHAVPINYIKGAITVLLLALLRDTLLANMDSISPRYLTSDGLPGQRIWEA